MLRRLISRIFGIDRRRRARFLKIMHGYRTLKNSGRLDVIADIKQVLTVNHLGLESKHFSSALFGGALESGELILRQYLLMRIGGVNLNEALLMASAQPEKGVVFPMPSSWRQIVEAHGFRVNHVRCAMLWSGYVWILFGYGFSRIAKTIVVGLRQNADAHLPDERYAYFADIASNNLPLEQKKVAGHDIISWYFQWAGRDPEVVGVRHSIPRCTSFNINSVWIRSQSGSLPSLSELNAIARYCVWGAKAIAISFLGLCSFRWWHAFLLNQAALAAQARFTRTEKLGSEYFFNNSGWMYRPLWTYELETRGIRTWFYFYSTNIEGFKTQSKYSKTFYGYEAMNWPRYIVWDSWQKEFVERVACGNPEIFEVGEVWFADNCQEIPCLGRPVLGLFDITPHRASRYVTLGLDMEYYVPNVVNHFVDDVLECSIENGYTVAWKRKRNIGKIAHPSYRKFGTAIEDVDGLMMVEPEISAFRLIEACDIVISLPFTSTALIGRNQGKPSAYYDPTGLIQKDDRAAHGIPVLSGMYELSKWIRSHTKS